MVEFVDGATIAQVSRPDMRGPIQFALTAPRRKPGLVEPMEWARQTMTFEQPDPGRFPALRLATDALRRGGTATTVLNAANEVAVAHFLRRTIRFPEIVSTVGEVLARHETQPAATLDAIMRADAWAREEAARVLPVAR
jgi:1-deoxy-D-xylulose-5-phosphate reductoisomerase